MKQNKYVVSESLGDDILVEGSLGGLQVLDLTSEGRIHQRIFSVGQDPSKAERCMLRAGVFDEQSSGRFSFMPTDNVQAMNFIVKKALTNKPNDQEQGK